MALTRRQREIYDFIRQFVTEKGYSPSLEEIGEAFGLSSGVKTSARLREPHRLTLHRYENLRITTTLLQKKISPTPDSRS